VPCGIPDADVTSLSVETGRQVRIADVVDVVRARVASALEPRLSHLPLAGLSHLPLAGLSHLPLAGRRDASDAAIDSAHASMSSKSR